MDSNKITYGREEGGFAVYVNGVKQSVFRIKGWMNNLREYHGVSYSTHRKKSSFERTNAEYHGRYID